MLVIFAYSITPKITLHSLLANHRDTIAKTCSNTSEQIGKAGFRCDTDDLVVHIPFEFHTSANIFSPPFSFASYFKDCDSGILALNIISFGLRGPPAIA
ncbi:MAG: hypothetical protein C5B52_08545 [Bacteroidetes bacterium]|nr:MAG: hypothetical protein C5B52_08545 [Bacteroidota bacterium]